MRFRLKRSLQQNWFYIYSNIIVEVFNQHGKREPLMNIITCITQKLAKSNALTNDAIPTIEACSLTKKTVSF
jgi:hypothetical protein